MNLFKPEAYRVESLGEIVRFTVGNVHMDMHYTDALALSQAFRVQAKKSKRAARDFSTHWSVYAELSNAEDLDKLNIPPDAKP